MKYRNRNLALGSAASFAIALIAAPCFAQSSPRNYTPGERAETQSLNAEQAAEPGFIVAAPPATGAPNAADVAAYNASVAEANAQAQAQYRAQLNDYEQRKNVYDAQRERYKQDLDTYQNPPVIVEERHVIVDTPTAAAGPEEHQVLVFPDQNRSLVSFADIASPDRELGGAPVEDRAGQMIGHFRYLTFQDGGQEKAVITLHNNKDIALDDNHLRFDADHDVVVADMTFDELNRMPARF